MQCVCRKLTWLLLIMIICYVIMLPIIRCPAVLSFVTDVFTCVLPIRRHVIHYAYLRYNEPFCVSYNCVTHV